MGSEEHFFYKKTLGQNFLTDQNIIKKIINEINPTTEDIILEIGPGKGALTTHLMRYCKKIILIEKDPRLAFYLKNKWEKINIILMDALTASWKRINGKVNKIVGNLPYNIASRLIWDICSSCIESDIMLFTIQKEVAEKIGAKPGQKKYGLFSVWVQTFCEVEPKFCISPNCFYPRPKVESQVIVLKPRKNILLDKEAKKRLSMFLKFCFKYPRKQLGTILKKFWDSEIQEYLTTQGFNKEIRPQMLSPKNFYELSLILSKKGLA